MVANETKSEGLRPENVRLVPDSWTAPLPLNELFAPGTPLEVDLGCGKGRFLLARARSHPDVNFFGIDRQLKRIRKVAKKAARAELANVRVLRCESSYAVEYLIRACRINTYYIFFPDPWPKKRHHKRRMFSPRFIALLADTLVPGGCVHVATDHEGYFMQIVDLMSRDAVFEPVDAFVTAGEEQTEFERIFLAQGVFIGRGSWRRRREE